MVIALVIAAALGGAVGWLVAMSRASSTATSLTERAAAAEADAARAGDELLRTRSLYDGAMQSAREERVAREERERRESQVLRALAPVRETLASMQSTVSELERERLEQFGTVMEQLRRAHQSDEALRDATASLSSALRSTSARGVWGEAQLKRVVEAAGMLAHVDFDTQATVRRDDDVIRPDMIVRLPNERTVMVDAKVPLSAFLDAAAVTGSSVEDESLRAGLLAKHSRALRAHIDALSKKAYWRGQEASPEFVVCFLPGESLLAQAFENDPTLLEHSFAQRVVLASPSTLIAILRTVSFSWTEHTMTGEARTLLDLGSQLYERISVLAGHADELRRSIERTVESYNRFAGSLESRVLVTARRFPLVDETKLSSLSEPQSIFSQPRHFAAAELLPSSREEESKGEQSKDSDDLPRPDDSAGERAS